MNQQEADQFFQLYQRYRFEHQFDFYTKRYEEFSRAQDQAILCSIGLSFLAMLAGALETLSFPGFRVACLFFVAICPILSSALAGYSALYGFEQQAKLYEDARINLERIRVYLPRVEQTAEKGEFIDCLNEYVQDVEAIFRTEQGYWGQISRHGP
jgi:hypothetical protein